MANGWSTREQYVVWRYDRARALGVDILKLLLNTSIVFAGVPLAFYEKIPAVLGMTKMFWLLGASTCFLMALLLGLLAFLMIFEGDYHGAHTESNRLAGNATAAVQRETQSNWLFHCGHWVGMLGGTSFALGIAALITAIWIPK